MPVPVGLQLKRLQNMGMRSDDRVHLLFQKYIRPLFLKNIRICGIFRPPMDKDDDKIRLPAGLSQLCAYPFFIL